MIIIKEKEKPRRYLQPAFAPITKEEKSNSWSDDSWGFQTPPSLATMNIDLSSQLTGVEVAAEIIGAQDSAAEVLVLFVPPRSDLIDSNSK